MYINYAEEMLVHASLMVAWMMTKVERSLALVAFVAARFQDQCTVGYRRRVCG